MNQHQPLVTPPESFSESPWERRPRTLRVAAITGAGGRASAASTPVTSGSRRGFAAVATRMASVSRPDGSSNAADP